MKQKATNKRQTHTENSKVVTRWGRGGPRAKGVRYRVQEGDQTSGVSIQLSMQMAYYNVLLKFMLLTNVTPINAIKIDT